MLTMPSLIPLPYKVGGAVILIALFSWKVYDIGAKSVQKKWDAQKVVDLAAVSVVKDRSQAVSEAIDKKHIEELAKIKIVTKTIIKEVPVYVNQTSDDACVIPSGFVLVHDAAASGQVPQPPSVADGSPSGVEVSTVGETVVENYGTYNEIRQQLIDLQEWVKKQGEVKP